MNDASAPCARRGRCWSAPWRSRVRRASARRPARQRFVESVACEAAVADHVEAAVPPIRQVDLEGDLRGDHAAHAAVLGHVRRRGHHAGLNLRPGLFPGTREAGAGEPRFELAPGVVRQRLAGIRQRLAASRGGREKHRRRHRCCRKRPRAVPHVRSSLLLTSEPQAATVFPIVPIGLEVAMVRSTFALLVVAGTAAVMAGPAGPLRTVPVRAADTPVTFAKDILPILQKNCQSCHRPGQIAPMSLLTYQETRPWARSIKAKVESRQMPPWFADPQHGRFANDRSLAAGGHRRDREVGGRRHAAGRPAGCAAADRMARRRLADQTRHRRPRSRVPCAGARAAGRRRVDDDPLPERLHEATRGSRRSRSSRACCR